jgi:hypothetical protein
MLKVLESDNFTSNVQNVVKLFQNSAKLLRMKINGFEPEASGFIGSQGIEKLHQSQSKIDLVGSSARAG